MFRAPPSPPVNQLGVRLINRMLVLKFCDPVDQPDRPDAHRFCTELDLLYWCPDGKCSIKEDDRNSREDKDPLIRA